MNDTFANRLKQALAEKKMTAAELARLTDTPESVISQYKRGQYEPKQRRLERFSQVLDVSIPWLMGRDVPMNSAIPTTQDISLDQILDPDQEPTIINSKQQVSHEELTYVKKFRSLTSEHQKAVKNMIDNLLEAQTAHDRTPMQLVARSSDGQDQTETFTKEQQEQYETTRHQQKTSDIDF